MSSNKTNEILYTIDNYIKTNKMDLLCDYLTKSHTDLATVLNNECIVNQQDGVQQNILHVAMKNTPAFTLVCKYLPSKYLASLIPQTDIFGNNVLHQFYFFDRLDSLNVLQEKADNDRIVKKAFDAALDSKTNQGLTVRGNEHLLSSIGNIYKQFVHPLYESLETGQDKIKCALWNECFAICSTFYNAPLTKNTIDIYRQALLAKMTDPDKKQTMHQMMDQLENSFGKARVNSLLDILQDEINKIGAQHGQAKETAAWLHYELKNNLDNFKAGRLTPQDFCSRSQNAIKDASPQLESLRGWKQLLADLASVVLNIGSLGLTYWLNGGQFRLFAVPSAIEKRVDEINRQLPLLN